MNFIPDSSSGLFGAMTLGRTAISIMTVSITDLFATLGINNTQHNINQNRVPLC